ncbi:hypothetical protein FRAAL0686 [Frankia alni ACN14a]|uniref:Uncharacterized protein n=1 Tax=Frankia alni (strain DSM 45986 / CECT 9034 / ACN14a) TaxID=326424 RepID=Q0RSU5_FRAAA|nr:hypothetical protein FRAAL0686 [Frankia alni ACN14a]
MHFDRAFNGLWTFLGASDQGGPRSPEWLMLLWAVKRVADGMRMSRWSEVHAELAAVLDAGQGRVGTATDQGHGNARSSRYVTRHCGRSERGRQLPADSSQQRWWPDQEDPAIGLSEPAFDLLHSGQKREQFLPVLRSFVGQSAKSPNL